MRSREELSRDRLKVAEDMLDYIWTCAYRGIAPLKADANLFLSRVEDVRHGIREVRR